MLVSVLLIIYNLFIALLSGLVFARLLSKLTGAQYVLLHPSLIIMLGWSFLAVQLQILHFFLPVNVLTHGLIWAVIIGFWAIKPSVLLKDMAGSIHIIANRKHLGIALVFLILVVLNICSRRADGDIGDYHLQAVRWMEEYAVVPGLGNIRRQLGNNSNWFLLNAFAGCHFLGLRSVYVLNAALAITVAMFVVPHLQQRYWLRNLVLLLYFGVVATRKYTGALTNDLVVTAGVVMLFVHFTDVMQQPQRRTLDLLVLMWLALVLITFKLSALPLGFFVLMLVGLIYRSKQMSLRMAVAIAGGCVLLILPWLVTNVMHSGYLLFPFPGTNWFGVDWQMRPEMVQYEVYANLAYARAPEVDIEVARYFNITEWWPHWVKSLDVFSMLLLAGAGLMLTIMFAQLITNTKFREQMKETHLWMVAVTTILALVLWFLHGPTPRFVFGYLIFTISMGLTLFNNPALQRILNRHYLKVVAVLLLGLVTISIKQVWATRQGNVFWMPPAYTQPQLKPLQVRNGTLWVPVPTQQCWDALLPCTNLPDSALEFRGNSLQKGFRIRQN